MATVMDVYRFLDGKAPFSTQMSFDNAGFLVGHGDKEVPFWWRWISLRLWWKRRPRPVPN